MALVGYIRPDTSSLTPVRKPWFIYSFYFTSPDARFACVHIAIVGPLLPFKNFTNMVILIAHWPEWLPTIQPRQLLSLLASTHASSEVMSLIYYLCCNRFFLTVFV